MKQVFKAEKGCQDLKSPWDNRNYMRKFILIIIILLGFNISFGQSDVSKNHIEYNIKTDIFMPVTGFLGNYKRCSLSFETRFNKIHSVQLTGFISSYQYSRDHYDLHQNNKSLVYGIIPEYKHYFTKNRHFYYGIYLKYGKGKSENKHQQTNYYSYGKFKFDVVGGGIIAGYQTYIKKRIVFDVLLGYEKRRVTNVKTYESINSGYITKWGSDIRIAINIGYKF